MKLIFISLLLFSTCSGINSDVRVNSVKSDTTDNIYIRVDTTVKEYNVKLNLDKYGSNKQNYR